MCSNPDVPFVAGFCPAERKVFVFKADCDLWQCPECAERKKRQWLVRAVRGCHEIRLNGTDVRFTTITSSHKLKSTAATVAVFPLAFGKLYQRMKRKTPDLHYLLIIEQHKDGRIHGHMLTDATMTKRWYKDNCASCGLGFMADVSTVTDSHAAAGYVTKYLTKSLAGMTLPPRFRRVRCTENWYKLPEGEGGMAGVDWLTCTTKDRLWYVVERARAENLTMVNPRSGEIFDYADAVETWYQ